MDRLGIIIQARTGSTRFSGKILKPFYNNSSIIDIIIEKIKRVAGEVSGDLPIILATTDLKKDDVLVEKAIAHDIFYFRGSEEDVLLRFIMASMEFKIDKIIRICSDNPFIDTKSINFLIKNFSFSEYDYMSFEVYGVPSIKTHFGLWAEAVSLCALKKAYSYSNNKIYKEHVTNFIYENSNLFNIDFIKLESEYFIKNIRLTIDTEEDFKLLKEIYSFVEEEKINDANEILQMICNNQNWLEIMRHQIEINSK